MCVSSVASSCFVSVMQAGGLKFSPSVKTERCLCKPHGVQHEQQSFPLWLETDTHFLFSNSLLCVYSHAYVSINSWQDCMCVKKCGCVCGCMSWLRLSLGWSYHWSCSNPFLCLCSTDLPVHTATVRATAAVSHGLSSLQSGSLAQHAHAQTHAESAGQLLEDDRREEEQDTDFKTEEGEKLSDIMSARQMSIKERSVYESVRYSLWLFFFFLEVSQQNV